MSSSPSRLVSSSLLAISLATAAYSSPLSTSPYNLPTERSPFAKAPLVETEHYHGTVNGSYIISLRDDISPSMMESHFNFLEATHQDRFFVAENGCSGVKHKYETVNAYSGCFHPETIELIRQSPLVEHVELDQVVRTTEIIDQNGAPWGLARLSHRKRLTFGTFRKYLFDEDGGEGVTAYVIDTGVAIDHPEFEGRATWGKTIPQNDVDEDANGHGTHCAGTIGSKSYGVAKKAEIVAVKVLGSNGSGTMSDVISGVDFAAKEAKAKAEAAEQELRTTGQTKHRGSVANMSLGGGKSPTLDRAVNAAAVGGLHFAVAAGNENQDACKSSPAASENALTLGASTVGDERAYFSNWGTCVDIFGPGLNIMSTWPGNATNTISGTSMASPHACGLMAYLLSIYGHPTFPEVATAEDFIDFSVQRTFSIYALAHASLPSFVSRFLPSPSFFEAAVAPVPKKPLSFSQLKEIIISLSTKDALTDVGSGSPNKLLYNNVTA
ncbi:proteinase B [Stygiomarasmius scandens]|uniref:Proteinase B n=1 Tax=Marasmiellus scandens TaxID=2682957 RepID=A0ABR1K9I0_9AGAR